MKKRSFITAALFPLFFITTCSGNSKLKIGFVGGLTGQMSELSVSGRNGAALACDMINAAGGINGTQVELIAADDGNTPEKGLQAVKELESKKVLAIIGHMTSSGNIDSFDYINSRHILMISPTVSNADYKQKDDYFIRIILTNESMGESFARYAVKTKDRAFSIAYETTNKSYTLGFFKGFEKVLLDNGGRIANIYPFTSGKDMNFRKIAAELQKGSPDASLLLAAGYDTASICQQLQKNGSQIKVYTAPWSMTNDLLEKGGKSVERLRICAVHDLRNNSSDYLEFKKRYSDTFKSDPSFASAYAYDAAMVLFTAMKKNTYDTPESIKKSILSIKQFKSLQDTISIDEYGDTIRNIYIYGIRNGSFVKLDPQ